MCYFVSISTFPQLNLRNRKGQKLWNFRQMMRVSITEVKGKHINQPYMISSTATSITIYSKFNKFGLFRPNIWL